MRVTVTGASGLIGGALLPALLARGHVVTRLVRGVSRSRGEVIWDPTHGRLDPAVLADSDALIHLSGESLSAGRWTRRRKRAIRESRVASTRLLAETLAMAPRVPSVWVVASAVGFYGSRGEETVNEASAPGRGFLADVVREWEAACEAARGTGIRIVRVRIGVVLTPVGGALAKMLPAFRIGAGGPIGDGRQWMSWITLDDLCGVIMRSLVDETLVGPVNAVAPESVRNREFARTLGRVLGRPALVRIPAVLMRLVFGKMAVETVLSSLRVDPAELRRRGHVFQHETLKAAFVGMLGGSRMPRNPSL